MKELLQKLHENGVRMHVNPEGSNGELLINFRKNDYVRQFGFTYDEIFKIDECNITQDIIIRQLDVFLESYKRTH